MRISAIYTEILSLLVALFSTVWHKVITTRATLQTPRSIACLVLPSPLRFSAKLPPDGSAPSSRSVFAYRCRSPPVMLLPHPYAAPSFRQPRHPPDAAPLLPTPLRDTVIPSPSPSGDSPLTRRALSGCGAMAPPWPSLSPPQVVLVASTAPLVLVC